MPSLSTVENASATIIDTIEGCDIRLEDGPEGEKVMFTADADIDADGANGQNGARAAYMADDSGSEALANGGMGIRHGEVVGIADFFKDVVVVERGKPKIFPRGVIVSKTAYHIRGEQDDTPKRYVDSETVPYVVIPPVIIQRTQGIVRGCFARVTYKGRSVDCMVGDVGPSRKVGEISIAAARAVRMPASPRSGGEDDKIVKYEIFPGRKATINGVAYPLMRSNGSYAD
jgi:Fungal chitosanase of glycosyl hydrolase group 75